MDDLLEQQKQRIFELKTHQENYSKAPKDRKASQKYLKNRLKELEDWWTDFESRDSDIREKAGEEDKITQPYFTLNTFDESKRVFMEHRKNIESNILITQNLSNGSNSVSATDPGRDVSEASSSNTTNANQNDSESNGNLFLSGGIQTPSATAQRIITFDSLWSEQEEF